MMKPGMAWLAPTLLGLMMYGVAQGLVKQYILDVPSAQYCLFFFLAKSVLNIGFFFSASHPSPFVRERLTVFAVGTLAYVLEGIGWICYYESIAKGPITIIGTLSAAYAAPTVIFAYILLRERLKGRQYLGVIMVITGCAGLAYAPADPASSPTSPLWIPLAFTALVLWGLFGTLVKYCYQSLGADERNMALYNVVGASLTTGLYGYLFGLGTGAPLGEWHRSVLPMLMMAGGDLCVIVATSLGKVSIVTAISGAYPVVTLAYATFFLKETITRVQYAWLALVFTGMFLSPGDE